MKNVLILGAGGQIARHVINQLADNLHSFPTRRSSDLTLSN